MRNHEDPPNEKHQYWRKDGAETACWSTKHRVRLEKSLRVDHHLPKQKIPADGPYVATFKCFPGQLDDTVIYAKDRQGPTLQRAFTKADKEEKQMHKEVIGNYTGVLLKEERLVNRNRLTDSPCDC